MDIHLIAVETVPIRTTKSAIYYKTNILTVLKKNGSVLGKAALLLN